MRLSAKKRLCLGLLWICWAFAAKSAQVETNRLVFGVSWPPEAPTETQRTGAKPLLNGVVIIRAERLSDQSSVAHLRILLSRPSDEVGRELWNSRLAFPEYEWMRYVRVWDKDNRWLWPNLPYLLRLHGVERVERYGGVDPGKGVDNDFAAVLIRKYDDSGKHEDPVTTRTPLVAAEWSPVGVSSPVDKQTIVHAAQSDEFMIDLSAPGGGGRGMAAVWLIYADFMGAKLPEAWPKVPEFAGGILAYFELQWNLHAEPGQQLKLRQLLPKRGTGFDWEEWALRTRAQASQAGTSKSSKPGEGKTDASPHR